MEEPEIRQVSVTEGYAVWAESYDHEQNGLIYIEERQVDRLLGQLTFADVLDVGTGTGRHALKLARGGAKVSAVDQSAEMLAVAKEAAQRDKLTIDFRLHTMEDDLPFEAGQFDLVICALMLCHLADLGHAVGELARVTQPGGHVLITDFHPVHREFGWRTAFRREGVLYHLPTAGHSRDDYLNAVRAGGLTTVEVVDSLVGEAPEGYLPEDLRRDFADKPFCLTILARK